MRSLDRVDYLVCSTGYTMLVGSYNGVLRTLRIVGLDSYIFLRHLPNLHHRSSRKQNKA